MQPFKLNLKETIVIIILSIPISGFLYLINYNKINYEIKAKQGFALSENFCENHLYTKQNLLKDSDINLIYKKYQARQNNLDSPFKKGNIKILLRNDTNTYDIVFKGVIGQESNMEMLGEEILKDILTQEFLNYNSSYKPVRLHCKLGEFTVFKIHPMEKINLEFPSSQSYKKSYLLFLTILPFLILYLLLISYNRLFLIIKSKNK